MFYNLRLAFRNLRKQSAGGFINAVGLILGLTVCFVIALFVQYEFSFEKHNSDSKNIYRLLTAYDGERTPIQAISFLKNINEKIPELKQATMVQYHPEEFFRIGNEKLLLKQVMFSDNQFIAMFKIHMLEGEMNPLSGTNALVISKSEAKKLFPGQDAIGKTLKYRGQYDFEVRGVFEDAPVAANYRPNIIMNIESKKNLNQYEYESPYNSSTAGYYLLPAGSNLIPIRNKVLEQAKIFYNNKNYNSDFQLQPLSDIHLKSADTTWDVIERSDIKMINTFIIISILIMLVVTFNYINLSLALRNKRNFTTGIQKVMGAGKGNIAGYLLSETSLVVGFCLVASLFLTWMLLPAFNNLMGTIIGFSLSDKTIWIVVGISIVMNILFPVGIQFQNRMRINPVNSVRAKGKESGKPVFGWLIETLSIIQIAVVIGLIAGIFMIYKQFDLVLKQKLGFDKSNLVAISNIDDNADKLYTAFKSELLKLPAVQGVTATWNAPGENLNNGGGLIATVNGEEKKISVKMAPTDEDFFKVLKAKFLIGKSYDATDSLKMVINRKCQEELGVDNPIGMKVVRRFDGNKKFEICGVIDDIQYNSMHTEDEPAVYTLNKYLFEFLVRLAPGNTVKNIASLEQTWNRLAPDEAFQYHFVDQDIANNYKREIRTQKLLIVMSLLSVIIAMLGLFGFTVFRTQARIKEIGIRKVNGAKVSEILSLLNITYIRWVCIAFALAIPVTWYALQNWLQHFAYKTELSWWIFALAGLAALIIALITVSWQSWKAAVQNPVEAFRYE